MGVLLVAGALLALLAVWPRTPEAVLRAGGNAYRLEQATTPQAQLRGLGGRAILARNAGMLFAYEDPAPNRCFWMKDMRFAVDIIWTDSRKRVVRLAQQVVPETYPSDFCAPEPSQFVIELRAGEARRSGIAVGQTLDF